MAKALIRTALERRHRKLISPLEARFARDYRALMGDLRESIRTSGAKPFNLGAWSDKAVVAMRPAYRAAILTGGRDFITNTIAVRSKIGRLKAAKKRSVGVVVSLEAQFEERLRETITTTYDSLVDILDEAVADKLDKDEVGDLIDEEWSDILGRRTDAIALTETNGAVNSVRDYLMLELVELQSWVNARDERVRPTHVIYGDAGPKPVGFDWSQLVPDAGYTLRYPCDPECHEPAEVINCRCFTVPEGELELSTADLKDYLADFEMGPEDVIRSEDQEPVYVTNAYTGKTVKGDVEGHPFRGNQYTDGGATPDRESVARDLSAAKERYAAAQAAWKRVSGPEAWRYEATGRLRQARRELHESRAEALRLSQQLNEIDYPETKGWEEQPRDENGRWGEGGGSIAAGGGAAREGRDRRVDGDGAHLAEGGPGVVVPPGSVEIEPGVYSVPGGSTVYLPGAPPPEFLSTPHEPDVPGEDEGYKDYPPPSVLRRRRNDLRDEYLSERIRTIEWVQPKRARGEEMVEVDVSKLDESWKGEPSYRIDEKGSNAIGTRLASFGAWLRRNPTTAVETPEVGLNQNGKISFTNGRHRFAYLRDRGVRTIFVSVPKSEARKVRAIAGVDPQKKGVLKGDLPGHEFRGNQWTTGAAAMEERSDLNALGKSKAKELQAVLDKADEALPQEAQDAITGFVGHGPKARDYAEETGGFGVMAERRLEDAMSADPSPEGVVVRDQLEAAFAPVREGLREMLGKDEVILYRAQRPVDPNAPDRNVLSWSMSREFVRDYSGASRTAKVYTEEETDALVREGEAKGEVEIGNHVLRRGTEGYWDIYQKADDYGGEEHITDVEGIRHYVEMENDDAKERNAANASKLEKVRRSSISLDDVVWATQRANQWEFIVRNRTGKKAADGSVLKGDLPGHEFRGNQWTGGQGGGDDLGDVRTRSREIEDIPPVNFGNSILNKVIDKMVTGEQQGYDLRKPPDALRKELEGRLQFRRDRIERFKREGLPRAEPRPLPPDDPHVLARIADEERNIAEDTAEIENQVLIATKLHEAVANAPATPGAAYRGIHLTPELAARLKPGAILASKQLNSWTRDPNVAAAYADKSDDDDGNPRPGAIVRVVAKASMVSIEGHSPSMEARLELARLSSPDGAPASEIRALAEKQDDRVLREVINKPGARYRVTKVTPAKVKYTYGRWGRVSVEKTFTVIDVEEV